MKTCPICNQTHERKRSPYCSDACKQKAWRERHKSAYTGLPYLLTCSACGHSYLAIRHDAKACSSSCRAYLSHQRAGRRSDAPVPASEWDTSPILSQRLEQVLLSGRYIDRR